MVHTVKQSDVDSGMVALAGYKHYFVEASELGLPPGKFPVLIRTDLGTQRPFKLTDISPDGTHHYRQDCGVMRLTVFND